MPRTPRRWKDSIEERGLQKPLEADVLLVLLCAAAARAVLLEKSDACPTPVVRNGARWEGVWMVPGTPQVPKQDSLPFLPPFSDWSPLAL